MWIKEKPALSDYAFSQSNIYVLTCVKSFLLGIPNIFDILLQIIYPIHGEKKFKENVHDLAVLTTCKNKRKGFPATEKFL